MTLRKTSGFTLVELAIVMTIIGLLIGGILKGQELLENARITSTIAQVKSYDSAVTGFRDIYDAMPGDMSNANTRIPGCVAACNITGASANDGRIGAATWTGTGAWAAQQTAAISTNATAQTTPGSETILFWIALLKANLISGVTDEALTTATVPAVNQTNPAAKIGGGFVAGFGAGQQPDGIGGATGGPTGTILGLVTSPTVALTAANAAVLAPARAGQIDRKMDDGMPDSGSIQAYGTSNATTGCVTGTGTAFTYVESNAAKVCGLVIKIQG